MNTEKQKAPVLFVFVAAHPAWREKMREIRKSFVCVILRHSGERISFACESAK
jgi:hypothetical protein